MRKRMKNIILFDMDGTLTPPREKIEMGVIDALKEKSKDFDIGIVTGSDFDYVMQQCGPLLSQSGIDPNRLHIFPCNGTKQYKWDYTQWKMISNVDMIEKIGTKHYKKILSKTFDFQSEILMFYPQMPLTGTFFQYRGTLLNWCPIGRIANQEQRESWKKSDKSFKIREEYMSLLQKYASDHSIQVDVVLGGSTSFDIFPKGWDKTYVMNHLHEYENVFFVGDKCQAGGNDKSLFDLLSPSAASFETRSPKETIEIISKIGCKLLE